MVILTKLFKNTTILCFVDKVKRYVYTELWKCIITQDFVSHEIEIASGFYPQTANNVFGRG